MAIIIAGMIGAGKTTVSNELAKITKTTVFHEPLDNPVLPEYYSHPKKYCYLLQTSFATERFNSMLSAGSNDILDRAIQENLIFGKTNFLQGNLNQLEWDSYQLLVNSMINSINMKEKYTKNKNLLVYLEVSYETCISNIKKRGRVYEQLKSRNDEKAEYYRKLISEYNRWYPKYSGNKIHIDMNNYDIFNLQDKEYVLNKIIKAKEKIDKN